MKIKKSDIVYIEKGKDRGKTGKVLAVFPELAKAIVDGINIRKRHVRPRRMGEKGQVVQVPGRIAVANLRLICANCKKSTRVKYSVDNGKKNRICKKCGIPF